MACGGDPSFGRQARNGGAYQPLGEAKRLRQIDQAAERHRTAARRNGIAEDRDEKRAAAQRPLALEAAQQGLDRGLRGGICRLWHGRILARNNVTQK